MSFLARAIRKYAVSRPPRVPPGHERELYLTFDDGPNPTFTPRVLDLLAAQQAAATFFVCGRQIERHNALTAQIVAAGHALANHTYSHPDLSALPLAAARAEVDRCQQLLTPFGGTRLFRPPHGLLGPRLHWSLTHAGYSIVYWSADSGDWQDIAGAELATRLLQSVRGGDVILFHDDRENGVAALAQFLVAARAQGFTFHRLADRQP